MFINQNPPDNTQEQPLQPGVEQPIGQPANAGVPASAGAPPVAPASPSPVQSAVPVSNSQTTPPSSVPPKPPAQSLFSGNLFKFIGIGLGILLFFFLIFVVIIPHFRNNKQQNVTLTYWGLWEDQKTMQPVLDDFHRQYPYITVQYTKEDINQYSARVLTRIKNGTGPDIFRYHNSWYPMLSHVLLPLPNDVISQDDFKKEFYKVAHADLIKNGAIYGVPLEIDTLSLYTNDKLLQAAGIKTIPKTWDVFKDDSKTLTVPDAASGKIVTAGAAMGTFNNIAHAGDILSLLFLQNGVDLSNLSATAQNAQDSLRFYTDFANGDQKVWDSSLDPSTLAFAKGNLAMYFGYSYDYFTIKALSPQLQFTVSAVPHLPSQSDMTIASYWAEGVSSASQHQKEAFLFMHYLAQKETEQKLFTEESKTRLFGEPYAAVSLASTLTNSPAYPFVQQAPNAKSTFFTDISYNPNDDSPMLNRNLNVYLGNAVQTVSGSTSYDTAIADLAKNVAQTLDFYAQQK